MTFINSNPSTSGLKSGFVWWNDVGYNVDKDIHYQPDGQYDDDTKIYFCCRHDSPPSDVITLPTNTPFFLLKYKNACQLVRGMTVAEDFVYFNHQNAAMGRFHYPDEYVHVPTGEYRWGIGAYIKMFYCYYKKG